MVNVVDGLIPSIQQDSMAILTIQITIKVSVRLANLAGLTNHLQSMEKIMHFSVKAIMVEGLSSVRLQRLLPLYDELVVISTERDLESETSLVGTVDDLDLS